MPPPPAFTPTEIFRKFIRFGDTICPIDVQNVVNISV